MNSRTILIVDDCRDNALSLAMLSRLKGYQAIVAFDGKSALEMVADHGPTAVLLDIGLPDLRGYEVARRIKAQEGNKPFLNALTGYGRQEDLQQSIETGIDVHMLKPVDPLYLFQVLDEATQPLTAACGT